MSNDDILKVRVPGEFRRGVEEAARRDGVTKAELVRTALAPHVEGAATVPPEAQRVAAAVVERVLPAIRAEVARVIEERGEEIAKAAAPDPRVAEALRAICDRLDRAERAAGV